MIVISLAVFVIDRRARRRASRFERRPTPASTARSCVRAGCSRSRSSGAAAARVGGGATSGPNSSRRLRRSARPVERRADRPAARPATRASAVSVSLTATVAPRSTPGGNGIGRRRRSVRGRGWLRQDRPHRQRRDQRRDLALLFGRGSAVGRHRVDVDLADVGGLLAVGIRVRHRERQVDVVADPLRRDGGD